MEKIVSDLTVVGGGIAGIAAAVTAARHGLQVALVQDREVLGGNVSSECQVSYGSGAVNASFYARESGISDEIKQRLFHANPRFRIKEDYYLIDDTLLQIVRDEPNISLFLGCSVYDAETEEWDGEIHILSVYGFCARTQQSYVFSGPLFVDASGDGILGYKSGAKYREGREAKSEYGEELAPEVSDNGKMGSCILFNVAKADHPVPFRKPSFAYNYEKDGILSYADRPHTGRELPGQFDGMTGLWWLSYGGLRDTVRDAYEIDWELKKLVYGYWDYVKNSGKYPGTENYYLRWVAPYAAKRESRRFLGDYVLSQQDICHGIRHEDDVSTGGWSIDCHDPGGIYGDRGVSLFGNVPAIYNIPYRCMYSVNVDNLFFAGRIVSATHLALGSIRVVQTLAAMAQAVGSAAVLCRKYDCSPRDIALSHCRELQTMLQRDGQYIIGLPEDCGLAAEAVITASSTRKLENTDIRREIPLRQQYCLCIPVKNGVLESVELYIHNPTQDSVVFPYEIWDNPIVNTYTPQTLRKTIQTEIPAGYAGWVHLTVDLQDITGNKVYLILPANEQLCIASALHHITGAPTFLYRSGHLSRCTENISFRHVLPDSDLYTAENVINGYSRPVGVPNVWAAESGCHESLTLHFREIQTVREIQIVFNSQLWKVDLNVGEIMDQMIPSFDISFCCGDTCVYRISEQAHYLPIYRADFSPMECDHIEITFHSTNGSPFIEVFAVKVF